MAFAISVVKRSRFSFPCRRKTTSRKQPPFNVQLFSSLLSTVHTIASLASIRVNILFLASNYEHFPEIPISFTRLAIIFPLLTAWGLKGMLPSSIFKLLLILMKNLWRDWSRRKSSSFKAGYRQIRRNWTTTQDSHRYLNMAIPNPGRTRWLQPSHPYFLLQASSPTFSLCSASICVRWASQTTLQAKQTPRSPWSFSLKSTLQAAYKLLRLSIPHGPGRG